MCEHGRTAPEPLSEHGPTEPESLTERGSAEPESLSDHGRIEPEPAGQSGWGKPSPAEVAGLHEHDLDPDPFRQFAAWLDAAVEAGQLEPFAMAVATATRGGLPSARMVLLRGFDERGFTFYTNYRSRKGREIAENPFAALLFHWDSLGRQVRIEGPVEPVSRAESEAYFATRPVGSRLAAWASEQSEVVNGREVLDAAYREVSSRFADEDVPLPPFWGGYRVLPESIEFWQSRPNRFHDRLRYRRLPDGGWVIERLAP